MQTKKFDLTKYKQTSIKSFTLRELTGREEMDAYERASGPGGKGRLSSMAVQSQLIADAIVEVNGEPVVQPYLDWEKWSLRTRQFVTTAFQRMNDVSRDELADFGVAAFGDEAPDRGA